MVNIMNEKFNNIDLKNMSILELETLANEIRSFLIESTSKTGGHLASNLGVVELTIAMHKNFNSPNDKFIFDVGHQCYIHKILTNRSDRFDTLRKKNGLSGFIKMEESEHDVWEAGHSSTSISAAVGFAFARDLNKTEEEIIAIIGDGSLTNGMAIEALNHLSELDSKVIIILNDNEMSISKNIGFIDDILKNIQYSQGYDNTKENIKTVLSKMPGGDILAEKIANAKNGIKRKIIGTQSFFNLMGFDYIGPIDGHDFKELERAFNHAKQMEHSVILHVKTKKGNGYQPAIDNNWHGVGAFDVETGEIKNQKKTISNSRLISNGLELLMQKDESIVVITPAMETGSELSNISQKFPERYTDVGIAEEHAITFAAALGLTGKKPFVSIYSTFLQRGYDQLFHDVVRQDSNVVIGIDRAGIVGDDGETHQGIYDISFMSHMPNLIICQGKDQKEIINLLDFAFKYSHPIAIRYPRGGENLKIERLPDNNIIDFSWEVIKENNECYIISYGNQVNEIMKSNLNCGIINARFIKPIDYKKLDEIKDKKIIVVEEHCQIGGLNTLIKDYLNGNVIQTITLPNEFIKQGNPLETLEEYNLAGSKMIDKIKELINE